MTRHVWVVALCACGLPGGDVLMKRTTLPLTTCEEAFMRGQVGDACQGITTCKRDLVPCCTETLECSGVIVGIKRDCSNCSPCADEDACQLGTVCLSGRCEPCPKVNEKCAECPDGLVPFERNGCATCDCGPPPECPPQASNCVPGAYCAASCTGTACCAKFLAQPGACSPNPTGCSMECGPTSCPGACFAAACTCEGSTWSCAAKCAPKTELFTARCKL